MSSIPKQLYNHSSCSVVVSIIADTFEHISMVFPSLTAPVIEGAHDTTNRNFDSTGTMFRSSHIKMWLHLPRRMSPEMCLRNFNTVLHATTSTKYRHVADFFMVSSVMTVTSDSHARNHKTSDFGNEILRTVKCV